MSDNTEITDTITAAKTYLNHLKSLHSDIDSAKEQIQETSNATEKLIETAFESILKNVTAVVNNRRNDLVKQVQKMREQSLVPLEECILDISTRIGKTESLINQGNSLLQGTISNFHEFNEKSSALGSLPEIPDLREVPYLSFQSEAHLENDLRDICSRLGEVYRIAPVQISQLSERPGAILVEWTNVDNDDRCIDIQDFRMQKAFGNVVAEKHLIVNFSDCYIGPEPQCLVKDLQPNQPYSFRVCCKFEGSNQWSPWSLPQVTQTTIKPFKWRNNKDFILADNNKIASPIRDSPSILASDGPQFSVGYSVEFTYLEFDKKSKAIIGLIVNNESNNIAAINIGNHFVVDSNGEIYVDGSKKSTKLPEASKGLKLCFTCESTHNNKVRVNIDSCDKRVTYDWPVNTDSQIYFAAQLKSQGSKIMVE